MSGLNETWQADPTKVTISRRCQFGIVALLLAVLNCAIFLRVGPSPRTGGSHTGLANPGSSSLRLRYSPRQCQTYLPKHRRGPRAFGVADDGDVLVSSGLFG